MGVRPGPAPGVDGGPAWWGAVEGAILIPEALSQELEGAGAGPQAATQGSRFNLTTSPSNLQANHVSTGS